VTLQNGTAMLVEVVSMCGTDRYGKGWPCDTADWYSVLVKVVSVCGTDWYGKIWACDSEEWYSAVGEG
jgi:hypothetical protein